MYVHVRSLIKTSPKRVTMEQLYVPGQFIKCSQSFGSWSLPESETTFHQSTKRHLYKNKKNKQKITTKNIQR